MASSKKKRILILHTGGTLGMTLTGAPDDPARFLGLLKTHAPQIFELAEIGLEIVTNKDSSNMQPWDWVKIARRLNDSFSNPSDPYDGFVIIHGTDTMAFTASALSFMLVKTPKPVIVTGAQRPLSDHLSDAARNLTHAVELAAEGVIKEVTVFFDTHLMRGNRAKKISIPSFKAFESPNFPVLGKVGVKTEYIPAPLPEGAYAFDPRIETRVAGLTLFPGLDIELFIGLTEKGVKGLVLQAFGAGNIPLGGASVVHLIQSLTEKGIPTVICSQTQFGAVDLNLYETGRAARSAGAISAGDMTWESALVKMMVLLGRGLSLVPFQRAFVKNLAGELTE